MFGNYRRTNPHEPHSCPTFCFFLYSLRFFGYFGHVPLVSLIFLVFPLFFWLFCWRAKGIPLYQCAHGNGQFQYNAPRGPLGDLPVNTGWIDNSWQMVKAAIPRGLHATKDGEPNPEVMQYVYSWSFRFHHRDAASREAAVGKLLKRERQKRRSSWRA